MSTNLEDSIIEVLKKFKKGFGYILFANIIVLFTTLITFIIISGSKNIEDIQSITKTSIIINIINCIIFLIGLSILYNSAELEKSTANTNFDSNINNNDIIDNDDVIELNKINTSYKDIIGSIVKLNNLEISQYDFPDRMNWNDAKIACEALGDGWRLPSLDELNILYENQNKIGGFADGLYWSSSENDYDNAWNKGFYSGVQNYDAKYDSNYVRAIRAF
jgi:hypothetical protein